MEPIGRYKPDSAFVPGDFYVEDKCCTLCGVPQMVAPDLIGKSDTGYGNCYWKKQPETPAEMEQAFAIFEVQELGCHRYAGTDEVVQLRIGLEHCDLTLPHTDSRVRRWGPIWSLEFDQTRNDATEASGSVWDRLRRWMKSLQG